MKIDDRILITGARGLVGSALADHLRRAGHVNLIEVGRDTCDLTDTAETIALFERERPDYVFHAAARVYGIMGNLKNKALSFLDNVMINTNVVEAAHRAGVKKILAMGTGAVYPYPSPSLPLQEDMIFLGNPHPAEDSYAHAKRAMLAMLQAYEESYGMQWVYIVSCNLFGPRDKFDTEFGHVVPSLIKKFRDAQQSGGRVLVWGDGSAQRDFLYVNDAARAVQLAMNNCNGAVNMGSSEVLRIREIVDMITQVSGMQGRVDWDASKPNGQDYRAYNLSKLAATGFKPTYSILSGLQETWDWYCRNAQAEQSR